MVSEGIARFGYRPEEVSGVPRWGNQRLHPEDRERIETSFEAALASDRTFWSDEYRLRRADGAYATVSDRAYIIRDATGRAVRVVGATTDMTERQLAEERRRLRVLSVGMLQAREEEARRIARELHDEAGQLLASVHIAVDRLAADTPALDRGRIAEIKKLLELTEADLRRIAHELRPTVLDDLGLGPALSVLADNTSSRSRAIVSVDAPIEDRLPAITETTVYRIVQEATANAVKHGAASRVDVRVALRSGRLECTVTDDGVGFDVDQASAPGTRGLGLLGIRERLEPLGGTLDIVSRPGAGTQISVTIPLEPHGAAHPAR
jgi:PAS domain S-box-containing protein